MFKIENTENVLMEKFRVKLFTRSGRKNIINQSVRRGFSSCYLNQANKGYQVMGVIIKTRHLSWLLLCVTGVSEEMCKVGSRIVPEVTIETADGKHFKLTTSSTFITDVVEFDLGEEHEITTADGRKTKVSKKTNETQSATVVLKYNS